MSVPPDRSQELRQEGASRALLITPGDSQIDHPLGSGHRAGAGAVHPITVILVNKTSLLTSAREAATAVDLFGEHVATANRTTHPGY
jgi:hypothetical protein